jgi:HAD superfamily hydrolase (TIGR01509 family)
VERLLEELHASGIPCAVASSTERLNITFALDRMDLSHEFGAIVAGSDVERGKPDPEVFLAAAAKLGTTPERCVVFEDAHVGIQAARAAGTRVVGIATTHPADTLQDADIVVERLDELTLKKIEKSLGF